MSAKNGKDLAPPISLVELSEDRRELMRVLAEKRALEMQLEALKSVFTITETDDGICVDVDAQKAAALLLGNRGNIVANDECG